MNSTYSGDFDLPPMKELQHDRQLQLTDNGSPDMEIQRLPIPTLPPGGNLGPRYRGVGHVVSVPCQRLIGPGKERIRTVRTDRGHKSTVEGRLWLFRFRRAAIVLAPSREE